MTTKQSKLPNNYVNRKAAARYRSDKPTLTDQTQAEDTDLNVILNKYGITGKAPGGKMPIPPGDYTDAPTDLRGHIELNRRVKDLQATLPEHLRNLTPEQIRQLDNKQLGVYNAIMEKQTKERTDKAEAEKAPKPQEPKT